MATAHLPLRFAYSTINCGTTPDLAAVSAEIRESGWGAIELFWHDLGWLGPPDRPRDALGGLQVATLFGKAELPIAASDATRMHYEIASAAEVGASYYGLIGAGDALETFGVQSLRSLAIAYGFLDADRLGRSVTLDELIGGTAIPYQDAIVGGSSA